MTTHFEDIPSPNMATPQYAYPIIYDKEKDLNLWLNILARINCISEPDPEKRICDGCHNPGPDLAPDKPEDQLIQLPCRCRIHRRCIVDGLSSAIPGFGPDVRCPRCGWGLFKPFLEQWLEKLDPVDMKDLDTEDRSCGICREEYGGNAQGIHKADGALDGEEKIEDSQETELPCRLPCGHHIGAICIKRWLTPYPKGGNGNACPTCRHVFFEPWSVEWERLEILIQMHPSEERDHWTALFADGRLHNEEMEFWPDQLKVWIPMERQGGPLDGDPVQVILDRLRDFTESRYEWDIQQGRRRRQQLERKLKLMSM